MAEEPMTISWTHHEDYFKLVLRTYAKIEELKLEHDQFQENLGGRPPSDEEIDVLASKNDAIAELTLVVVVFAAFTLEAYINHYGISRLSGNYFSRYLDRLDVLAKWIVIPRIVTGSKLNPGSRAMQDLNWLVGLRNKRAHYKSKDLPLDDIAASELLWYEDAEKAVKTVRELLLLLKRVDPEIDTDWLSEGA